MAFSGGRRYGGAGIRRGLRTPIASNSPLLALNSGVFSRSSSASYWSGLGSLVKVSSDVFRKENRGGGNGGLWLLEGARENKLTYSEDHTNWTNQATIDADAATAPDGTTTVDGVEDANAGLFRDTQIAVTGLTATAEHAISHFIRKDAAAAHFIEVGWAGTHALAVRLTNGSTSTRVGSPRTFDAYDAGDWWWVVWTENTTGTSHTYNIQPAVGLDSAWPSVSASGVGETFPWGAQFEEGSYPSSYIATSGSSVIRAADSLTFSSWPEGFTSGIWEMDFAPYFAQNEVASDVVLVSFGSADELRYVAASDAFAVYTSGVQRGIGSALTFDRHQKLTIKMDWVARECTISGATTGNSTFALSSADEWPSSGTLRFGGRVSGNLEADGGYSDVRSAT